MTVVAWDGRILAADKRGTAQGHAYAVTKIFRSSDDVLLGVCGNLARGHAMRRWFEAGRVSADFPKETTDDWAMLLVIHRDGTIWKYESREHYFVVEERSVAMGAGRDYALMAMHMGRDAYDAVRLTCELSVDCGNGVDTLTFEDAP